MVTKKDDELAQLRADFDVLREDIAKLAESFKSLTVEGAQAGLDAAKAQARRAQARAGETAESLERQIEERPFTSVMIALGLGFLLGKLLDR